MTQLITRSRLFSWCVLCKNSCSSRKFSWFSHLDLVFNMFRNDYITLFDQEIQEKHSPKGIINWENIIECIFCQGKRVFLEVIWAWPLNRLHICNGKPRFKHKRQIFLFTLHSYGRWCKSIFAMYLQVNKHSIFVIGLWFDVLNCTIH